MILWLIGISGAGKTTIGEIVVGRLREQDRAVAFIDGDTIREVWSDDLGHSMEQRRKNHTRLSKLCGVLDQDGFDVVVSALSIFPDLRMWNKTTYRDYVEIVLDVPVKEASLRDPKGIYAGRRRGDAKDVVGIDIDFPITETADLVIGAPDVLEAPERVADRILDFLQSRGAAANYAYTGRDLFNAPETYEFSQCVDSDFLVGWRKHRQGAMARLMAVARVSRPPNVMAHLEAMATPIRVPEEGQLTTIMAQLASIISDPASDDQLLGQAKEAVDAFVKKFEIFRRLYRSYDAGLRKSDTSAIAGPGEYLAFASVLVVCHDRTGGPIYVSTLLKLVDALLSRWGTTDDVDFARGLCAAIEAEAAAVARWTRHLEWQEA